MSESMADGVVVQGQQERPAYQTVTPRRARGIVRRCKWIYMATRKYGVVRLHREAALRTLKIFDFSPVKIMTVPGVSGFCLIDE